MFTEHSTDCLNPALLLEISNAAREIVFLKYTWQLLIMGCCFKENGQILSLFLKDWSAHCNLWDCCHYGLFFVKDNVHDVIKKKHLAKVLYKICLFCLKNGKIYTVVNFIRKVIRESWAAGLCQTVRSSVSIMCLHHYIWILPFCIVFQITYVSVPSSFLFLALICLDLIECYIKWFCIIIYM